MYRRIDHSLKTRQSEIFLIELKFWKSNYNMTKMSIILMITHLTIIVNFFIKKLPLIVSVPFDTTDIKLMSEVKI